MSKASRQRYRQRRKTIRAAHGKILKLRKVRRELIEAARMDGLEHGPFRRTPLTVNEVQMMRARRRA